MTLGEDEKILIKKTVCCYQLKGQN